MRVVPDKAVDKVSFYENHIAPWTTNAGALNIEDSAVSALNTKTNAARDAYNAQQLAKQVAKAATITWNDALADMALAGSAIISQIHTTAETGGDAVYALAQIPAPASPAPAPPPGTPNSMSVTLNGNGSLSLKWKCPNPSRGSGTLYQIWRRFGGIGEYTYLGGSGGKAYTDSTIPAGETQVTYMIQAVRSTVIGQWATFNVNFGTNTGGAMTASVTASANTTIPTTKLAA